MNVKVTEIVDLAGQGILAGLGVDDDELQSPDFVACQQIGGNLSLLGAGGFLVPSARKVHGVNLVILPELQVPNFGFEIVAEEALVL